MTVTCFGALLALVLGTHSFAKQTQLRSWNARRGLLQTSDLAQGDIVESRKWGAHLADDREKRAKAIEKNFSIILTEWSIIVGPQNSAGSTEALFAEEHQLAAQLHQIVDTAGKLVHTAQACHVGIVSSNSHFTGADKCPWAAPELLQGSTLSFLASLLRTYPRGPTSQEGLVAWTAAAIAFLQEHHRLQVQQRNMAQQVADMAADAAAFHAATRAAAAAARKAARKDASGVEDSGGSDGSSSGIGSAVEEDYSDELGTRRFLREAALGAAADGGDRGEDLGATRSARGDDNSGGGSGEAAVAPPEIPASFTGVQYGGLPLVRRVLLAQLLMGWMNAIRHDVADVANVATEKLAHVVTLIYKIHVESVAQRAVMEYFHISKAGGTSWTSAASASGCQRPTANAARDRSLDDDCRWINGTLIRQHGISIRPSSLMQVCSRYDLIERRTDVRDCVGRLRRALNRGFQYISNEYTLHGGLYHMHDTHICPQFVNVISIREPLERLVSNIKYMLVRLRATLFRKPPASDLFRSIFCNASVTTWELYSPPVADNYNIRTLVGERAFHTPLYGIGEAHEAVAKQLLLQYDLVLDLNAGDEAADLIMREGLGWDKTLAEVRVWTIGRLAKKAGVDLDADCGVGDLKRLLERQVYDQQWYSFGHALSRLDQLFLSAAVHLGLKPWPEEWAQVVWASAASGGGGAAAAAAASPVGQLLGRCGLLGATQVLREAPQSDS